MMPKIQCHCVYFDYSILFLHSWLSSCWHRCLHSLSKAQITTCTFTPPLSLLSKFISKVSPKMKNLNERATLFKITSNAMINACTEFMELTQSQGQRLVLICISFDIRVEHHGTYSKVRSEAIFLFPSCSLFGQKWGVSCRIDTSHMIKIILKEV